MKPAKIGTETVTKPCRVSAEGVFLRPILPAEVPQLLARLPRMQWDPVPGSLVEWTPVHQDEALAESQSRSRFELPWFDLLS
jgi:hypothetical protein